MPPASFSDIDFAGEVVLLRADLNVSLSADGTITDAHRIVESIPTIRALQAAGARTVVCSHLGRPSGPDSALSLRPLSALLARHLESPVAFATSCQGSAPVEAIRKLPRGGVLLLENLRFHPEEEQNDPEFARELASLATVFVNDAFGTMHRKHASIVGVPQFLPAVAGLLVGREIEHLSYILNHPDHPTGLLLGGAKVEDKLPLLEYLLPKMDVVCIGGAMADALLRHRSGTSPVDSIPSSGAIQRVSQLLQEAEDRGSTRVLLPSDVVATCEVNGRPSVTSSHIDDLPEGWAVRDIGSATARTFAKALRETRTVVWNGPMGVIEQPAFSRGSIRVAVSLSESSSRLIAGGGDTAAAIQLAGVGPKFWHISTGGGATLEYLSGRELPGIAGLHSGINAARASLRNAG